MRTGSKWIESMAKYIIAFINILLGPYCAYWGWTQGGVYIPTVFFIGSCMTIFGITLFFVPDKKK